jgi:hypothetical protein
MAIPPQDTASRGPWKKWLGCGRCSRASEGQSWSQQKSATSKIRAAARDDAGVGTTVHRGRPPRTPALNEYTQ